MTDSQIRPKERDAVIQSLRAGVVPRMGQRLVQVGRVRELEALIQDIERIADGGSGIRLVIGEYGSGKTFFLHLVRMVAMEKKLVATHADLTPERRLYGGSGFARSLYAELMRNLGTRTRQDGGALPSIVEKFISSAVQEGARRSVDTSQVIMERLGALTEMLGGYDFAQVVAAYWSGHDSGNEQLKSDAIRWLRGEFSTKTDARKALGVRTIVDDSNIYDQLKLMARFVRLAGYSGLLVCLDELVNLYKLANTQARNTNYEQILRILNDCLQGSSEGLGIILGGTPEFLMDTRKGLYSYQALQSRLADNTFAVGGLVDLTGPVMRLSNLSPEDLYVLLTKIRHVYAWGDADKYLVPDGGLTSFMQHCSSKIGEAYFRTPRNTITAFVNLLAVLEQNQEKQWHDLIESVAIAEDSNPDLAPITDPEEEAANGSAAVDESDDGLSSFRL